MTPEQFERFDSKCSKGAGCWEWTGWKNKCGYGRFDISRHKKLAHRLAYEHYVGPITKPCVLHSCDNPSCVRPDHLFLGTQADNNLDRDAKGRTRFALGSDHWSAKLTESQVLAIRRSKESESSLAGKYGVCKATVNHARTGRTWGWLDTDASG